MSLLFSKTCELAFQASIYFTTRKEYEIHTADKISKSIDAPKEYVSKVLQALARLGIIASKKGKNGGFFLTKEKKKVVLLDIVEEIDGLGVFSKCLLGYKDCGTSELCPVHDSWGKIREEIYTLLKTTTLDQLEGETYERLKSL